jgi:sugar phosphate isomerase/epimerase
VVQWLSPLLRAENLSLSSLEAGLRRKSVERIKSCLPLAAECGATEIGLISGADPGAGQRRAAAECLADSLLTVCSAAAGFGISVILEPLDRGAHKNGLIGPSHEAVALMDAVALPHIGLAWDSAHAALNNEDLEQTIESARRHIRQIHLSNAVLDSTSPLFGDHHMPIGTPGFLDYERILCLFKCQRRILDTPAVRVAVETKTPPGADPFLLEQSNRQILIRLKADLEHPKTQACKKTFAEKKPSHDGVDS